MARLHSRLCLNIRGVANARSDSAAMGVEMREDDADRDTPFEGNGTGDVT